MNKPTPLDELLEHFEAGAFGERVAKAIADTALLTVVQDGKQANGKVVLTLSFVRIRESSQVQIVADVKYEAPTSKGRKSESYATELPLHVSTNGRLVAFPEASPMFPGTNPARKD